jgi:hypothetical protein
MPFARRIAGAVLAAAVLGCGNIPKPAPKPAITALVVRNTSPFDVGVYALTGDDHKPVWLGTAPPASVRSFALYASNLAERQSLIVETRAVGSTRVWKSSALRVADDMVPVLDIRADGKGTSVASALNSVTTADYAFIMR